MKLYTDKQIRWMRKHCKEFDDWKTMTEVFNRVFDDNRTVVSMKSQGHSRHINLAKNFTEEQKQWLINHANSHRYSMQGLTYLFNHTFGTHKTLDSISMICHVYLKVGTKEFYNKTAIKKVGHEIITHDGYIKVKVSDVGDPNTKFKLKHRVIWEQAYGPVPEGCFIVFVDGNKRNFDLSNLRCVTRYVNGVTSGYKGTTPEIFDTAIMVGTLSERVKELCDE